MQQGQITKHIVVIYLGTYFYVFALCFATRITETKGHKSTREKINSYGDIYGVFYCNNILSKKKIINYIE